MSDEQNAEFHTALFGHLVISLAQSAMIGLGKVIHPGTGKAEVNLEAAQQAIDLLDMLEAKTKGNLGKDEEGLLKNTLGMLKLNFVETANAAPTPASAPATPPTEPPPSKAEDDKVKFRKTYS